MTLGAAALAPGAAYAAGWSQAGPPLSREGIAFAHHAGNHDDPPYAVGDDGTMVVTWPVRGTGQVAARVLRPGRDAWDAPVTLGDPCPTCADGGTIDIAPDDAGGAVLSWVQASRTGARVVAARMPAGGAASWAVIGEADGGTPINADAAPGVAAVGYVDSGDRSRVAVLGPTGRGASAAPAPGHRCRRRSPRGRWWRSPPTGRWPPPWV